MIKLKKRYLSIIKGVTLFVSFLLFIFSIITVPFLNKIYPNIYVAGVYVGDKSKSEAIDILSKTTLTSKVSILIKGEQKEIVTSEIIKEVDYSKSVDRAYNYSNTGNLLLDLESKIKLIIKPVNLGLTINFDDKKFFETLSILSSKSTSQPIKPSVKISGTDVIIDSGKNGTTIDINSVASDIKNSLVFNDNQSILVNIIETNDALTKEEERVFRETTQKLVGNSVDLKLDFDTIVLSDDELVQFVNPKGNFNDDNIKAKIAEVSRKINRNPQDSVFIVENGTVKEFTPSLDGITVNEDKLTEDIKNTLSNMIEGQIKLATIDIPTIKSPAKIKNEDVNNLGIKTLLGKGVSHFAGSIPNRIHNVNLAQSKFKGILVPPNEVFSFNSVLGDVSSYTGYKAAYVIKDGKTVLGDGGGVCQVSTTLFRAVLSAGLPIVERRPHSYRVGYYEQGFGPGLDATVYYPTTDFKFKNDTPSYILIQPTIDNPTHTLTFEIYGTDDGRVSTVSKPVITSSSAPAADLYIDDPTLKTGVVKQIEHRAYGAKVVFDYKVIRNGETLIDQKFVSSYRPWQAVYLRGTGVN